jgi:hypothetical protein
MKLKKFILNFLNNWTRPIVFFAISLFLFISIIFLSDSITLENITFCILLLSVLTILISSILQLIKGKFLNFFLTLCSFGVGIAIFLFASTALFLRAESMPDEYADNLTVPQNLKIYLPSDTTFSIGDTLPNFQIYDGFQPGIYTYTIWTRKIEKGFCYLKAYEVTHNDPLSVERLKERSKIQVYNNSDTIKKFEIGKGESNVDRDFTIYEGDWGKPYAARFELWFVPTNGGQEIKIAEKNFRIEGWMR